MIYTETEGGSFTSEDGRSIPNDPANRDYLQMQAEVLAGESTIVPYAGSDTELEALRADAYAANAAEADAQQLAAEANPTQGTNLDSKKTAKENSRRNNRAKGKLKITDADDELSDHVDSIMDVLDNADDAAESADKAALEAWDAGSFPWPVWNPPA